MPLAKDESQVSGGGATQTDDLGTAGPTASSLSAAGDAAISRQAADDTGDPTATLRKLLGPQIADIVLATITPEELLKWGKSISDSALKQAQSALTTQLEEPTPKGGKVDGLEQFFASSTADFMLTDVKAESAAFLASPEGSKLAQTISDKLHGSSVVTITSILVAAAYLATSDLKTPDIKKTLGAGFTVSGSADFGKIQHLALQSLGAQLAWKGGDVDASVGVTALAGKDASTEVGGKAKAKLTSGNVGDATTVEKLQAALAWKVDDHLALRLGNTTDLQSGHLVKGTLDLSGSMKIGDNANVNAVIDEQYAGSHTGVGASVQFTMKIDHGNGAIGFKGSYDPDKRSYAGVFVALRF